jgi:hypothetical protein
MEQPVTEGSGRDRDAALVRSLADQFKALNVLWATLTVLQVLSCAGIVAAAWNAYVLSRRWKFPGLILARSPAVVLAYQDDVTWFVIFFAVNVLLGGVVGAGLIAWEFFFIREKILKNAHIFQGLPDGGAGERLPGEVEVRG